MINYEYTSTQLIWGDLTHLNVLGSRGWRVIHIDPKGETVLLERPYTDLSARQIVDRLNTDPA